MKKVIYLIAIAFSLTAFKPIEKESKTNLNIPEQIVQANNSDCEITKMLLMDMVEEWAMELLNQGDLTGATILYRDMSRMVENICD